MEVKEESEEKIILNLVFLGNKQVDKWSMIKIMACQPMDKENRESRNIDFINHIYKTKEG